MADTVYYDPLSLGTHYNVYSGFDCVQWVIARKNQIGGVVYTGNGGSTGSPIDSTAVTAGAVAKYGYDNDVYHGHIAFVEYIDSNGEPVFSNADYYTANACYVCTKSEADALYTGRLGYQFKGYWYTNAVPRGSGPTPPTPTEPYVARGDVNSPAEGCWVGVALGTPWDWPADSEYKEQVSWTDSSDSTWVYFKAFNEAGNDEDGNPKVEFLYWNDLYGSNPRMWSNTPTHNINYTAFFGAYPWYYFEDGGSLGPGYVEAGFSTSSTSQDFKWRPHYHQNDTIYEVPKPSVGCIFKGWDVSGNDRSAYKTVPGSTESNITAKAYFASLTNPNIWQFTDDTYSEKKKIITSCSCIFSGTVLGKTTVKPKIGLYINDQLVAEGSNGTINWTGSVATSSNNVKVRALENSGSNYFMNVSLSSFKLTYYIYESENSEQGEIRYLCTRYFNGTKWTDWVEEVV